MKITRLKEIIREEVKKALKEKNDTEVAPVKPDTGTKVAPVEKPGTGKEEWGHEISPEPTKAKAIDVAKKISEKISKRYTNILKNKK
jgi:hypothetical protein